LANPTEASVTSNVVNDIHSELNETVVDEIVSVDSLESIREAILRARSLGKAVAIAGGRHAMGGQQFCGGGMLLDTRGLDKVLGFDAEGGTIEVEAGIQWPGLIDYLARTQAGREPQWGIAQKQTGADRLSIGGGIAANVHGRGLAMKPLIADLESFVLVNADGDAQTCSREENEHLFRLAVGGYGLFGCVYSATLKLLPRRTLERVVEVRRLDELMPAFEERIRDGFLYGDFQFAIDEKADDFLRKGVFSCYRPIEREGPPPAGQRALSREDWQRLIYLAHTDKSRAFEIYSTHYLATSGQIYYSDAHQLADYADGYHKALDQQLGSKDGATEMITEIYVPRDRLIDFLEAVADDFRSNGVNLIYGTIRLIERDEESFLAWATDRWACIIFNLCTVHSPAGLHHSADAFRRLIDLAVERGGSYYLTYHRWATRAQVETCYPQFAEFLALKREHDPEERFQSDWYRHYRAMFERAEPAAASQAGPGA
jgi:FAD/FMN-containing dehydrogenase